MLDALICAFFALGDVISVAEGFVGVAELAFLSTPALHAFVPESDKPLHAGCAGSCGVLVALEAPLPAQVEGAYVAGTVAL